MEFLCIFLTKRLILDNLGQNICRLFHILTQFLFTTSVTELDYYQQKVNEPVAEQLTTSRKLKKMSEILGFDDDYHPVCNSKRKF